MTKISSDSVIAIVGLGYVGLPLAVEFGKKFRTIGYDLSTQKVAAYREYGDPTGEVTSEELRAAKGLTVTTDPTRFSEAEYIIVAVPTPVDIVRRPDFGPLLSASETVGRHMKRGATVIYESTVYPGATEEVCIPVLERYSGLKWKQDFHVGYSPERINPGDREHTLSRIIKVVSGDDAKTLESVASLYGAIVELGVHRASSIKVAEAAKVIENTQRDLNIALMNELAIIFDRLGINTTEVLEAAGTKWNFLKFRPGLVGGHCIGVDPYYLTHKAESVGFHPQMILAGRRINDGMASYIAGDVVKTMLKRKQRVENARVLVMGFTFKENCPDTRNTKVADLVQELAGLVAEVAVYDPVADVELAKHEYGIALSNKLPDGLFDAVVLAVKHDDIAGMGEAAIRGLLAPNGLIYDIKGILPTSASNARL